MFSVHNTRTIRWKWLEHMTNILSLTNMEHVLNVFVPTNNVWSNDCCERIKSIDFTNLMNQASTKSSLSHYIDLKPYHHMESYLLDETDFIGVNLKFKVRSNILALNSRTYKWNKDINDSGICSLCNNDIEDIYHFLFTCTNLNTIRIDEYIKLESCLLTNNVYDVWGLFIAGDLKMKLMLALGNTSSYNHLQNSEKISSIFDTFCKRYIKRAWNLRNDIIN
jgi:hypothetical protein